MISGLARRRRGGLSTRSRGFAVYALLLVANFAAWAWAFSAFHAYPILLGTAALAYSFGLRHAFDADHIAAIDNVTRKLMQEGQRPVGVGLFFSLGHSTVVVGLSIAIAVDGDRAARPLRRLQDLRRGRRHAGLGAVPVRHRGGQRRSCWSRI